MIYSEEVRLESDALRAENATLRETLRRLYTKADCADIGPWLRGRIDEALFPNDPKLGKPTD